MDDEDVIVLEGTAKRSLNLRVSEDTYERLSVHAMGWRMTVSGLVEDLARAHCRVFSIRRDAGVKGGPSGESPEGA